MFKFFKKKGNYIALSFLTYVGLLFFLVECEKNTKGASIHSMFDAFWYSIVTLSTVGYGDYYPVTILGRLIGLVFVFASLGVLGYLISQLTIKLTQYMEDKKNGLFGTKIENHIVLIGYDDFTDQILKQVVTAGIKVAVVTNNKEDINKIDKIYKGTSVFTLLADYNNFNFLEKVNISKCSKVFINFNDDNKLLVYTLNLKNHFKNLDIVVSLTNNSFKNTFKAAGVLYAISREQIAAKLVASFIFEPEVALLTEDLMSSAKSEDDFDIIELRVTKKNPYFSKDYDYAFSAIRADYASILVGIYTEGKVYKNPMKKIIILQNDYLLIMTNGNNINKLKTDFGVEEGRY